jgi:hypothetical protein
MIHDWFRREKYWKFKLDEQTDIEACKMLCHHKALVDNLQSPSIRLVKV